MRSLLPLVLLLVACGPASSVDGGIDSPSIDAGPRVLEVLADLGSPSEGIALGRNAMGADVLYVGTRDDRLLAIGLDGVVREHASIHQPLGIAPRSDDSLVVCAKTSVADGEQSGLFEVATDGTVRALTTTGPGGAPFALINFVAIASDGTLVFSDSAGDALYRADADGTAVGLVTDTITYPNGLAFSADGRTLYVASWDTTTLYALAFDPSTSTYGAPSAAVEGVANVDGIVVTDASSLVLVTSTAGILRVDLASPTERTELLAPSALPLPANGVFGAGVFSATDLYVTSLSRSNLYVVHTALITP